MWNLYLGGKERHDDAVQMWAGASHVLIVITIGNLLHLSVLTAKRQLMELVKAWFLNQQQTNTEILIGLPLYFSIEVYEMIGSAMQMVKDLRAAGFKAKYQPFGFEPNKERDDYIDAVCNESFDLPGAIIIKGENHE